jgi:hypothetical protein
MLVPGVNPGTFGLARTRWYVVKLLITALGKAAAKSFSVVLEDRRDVTQMLCDMTLANACRLPGLC